MEKLDDLEQQKIEAHPYITINGKEPTSPKSFFQTKKFLLIAGLFGALIVAASFWLFFQ